MSVKTETRRAGDFVLSEANGNLSRDEVTIAEGVLVPGTVLAKLTATGEYVQLAAVAEDPVTGSEVPVAVLHGHADATDAAVAGVAYTRLTEVRNDMLVWPAGYDVGDKTAALLALAGSHIVAR